MSCVGGMATTLDHNRTRRMVGVRHVDWLFNTPGWRRGKLAEHKSHRRPSDIDLDGVVTLSEMGPIWTINHQAKPLKSLASISAYRVSLLPDSHSFRSIQDKGVRL